MDDSDEEGGGQDSEENGSNSVSSDGKSSINEEQSLAAASASSYIASDEELFNSMDATMLVDHVQCRVHTLKLAILDGLRIAELKKEKHLALVLHQETRWSSTYLMLDRLIQLKSTLIELGQKNVMKGSMLISNQWRQLEELRDLLHKPAVVTAQLQTRFFHLFELTILYT